VNPPATANPSDEPASSHPGIRGIAAQILNQLSQASANQPRSPATANPGDELLSPHSEIRGNAAQILNQLYQDSSTQATSSSIIKTDDDEPNNQGISTLSTTLDKKVPSGGQPNPTKVLQSNSKENKRVPQMNSLDDDSKITLVSKLQPSDSPFFQNGSIRLLLQH
jgi:hypothetical protein